MKIFRVWVTVVMLCWVGPARADCNPSGRATFVNGVDALSRGDLAAARQAFETLTKDQPDCAEARNNLAVVLVEQGQINGAAEQLRRALELQPDYQRARLNMERVKTMLTARAQANPPARPTLEVEGAAPPQPTAVPAQAGAAHPTAPPSSRAVAALPPPPPNLAALEPEGTTAGVVDLSAHRLCVYQRSAAGITADACYALTGSRSSGWPGWLVASDLSAKRIRLVDTSGEKRLKVVPTGASASDTLQLTQADYNQLSKKVVPWRTQWVVLGETSPVSPAVKAAAESVHDALDRWRQAWEHKQVDAYVGFYSSSFVPQSESSLARWKARKRELFDDTGKISVQLAAPSIVVDQADVVITSFEQKYRSNLITSLCVKVLRWQRQGDRWQITAETVLWEES